ncbi:MAG: hypothetical protein NXH75_05395 [Halobacteriovoraceae bacterium]|nr:hypothetical protein [Halobacteriovoraceae bacterium]
MKNIALFLIVFLIIPINTQAYFSPLGFSFTSEGEALNFPPKDWSVYGLRTNLFGAENKEVVGFDIGGFNLTRELMAGVQFGGVNVTEKKAYILGAQFGAFANINRGDTNILGVQISAIVNNNKGPTNIIGAQMAVANVGDKTSIYGYQLAIYNRAYRVVGAQVGIVNYADNLHGVQIGLLNICKSCLIGIMPGINIGFW